jgi:hypothetical protein
MDRRSFIKTVAGAILHSSVLGVTLPAVCGAVTSQLSPPVDTGVKDYLTKMQFFNLLHNEDICLQGKELALLTSTVRRLERIQSLIGHGNFYLAGFDEIIKVSKNYSEIGLFPNAELSFMEDIFYRDASEYGFLGDKPYRNITDTIALAKVVKVSGTGQYLYNTDSLETFKKVKKDLGDEVILTSGLRGIAKQFLLFLDKAKDNGGNLSLASRSLAPPGYSFHSAGDFDVGQINMGGLNFTEEFTQTDVYKKLVDRGYARLRYDMNNLLGVRFEPWHIKLG